MSRLVLAAAACAALLATHQPAVAGPEAPGPTGLGCGLVAVADPGTSGGDVLTGALFGGPVIGDGTLTCTVQVGASNHSGPDAASASASGTGIVVLPPTLMSFIAPEHVPIYVCTQWTDPNGTVYWHPTEDPDGVPGTGDETPGHWTADPNKPCALASGFDLGDLTEPLFGILYPLLCPVLRSVFPPEGDVPEIGWDCPPSNNGWSLVTGARVVVSSPPLLL